MNGNNIDSLRVLLFEYNVDNPDEDIDPDLLDDQEQWTEQILNKLSSSPEVLNYKIDRISNPDEFDPYLDENLENTLSIYNRNVGNPSNGMGNLDGYRFVNPNLNLPESGVPEGVFIDEVTEATAGFKGVNGISSANYTVTDGELNEFGKTIYRMKLFVNKGTNIK